MNFCERLREIRNELKTIVVIQNHSLYNLRAYTESILGEIDRLEKNGKKAEDFMGSEC